VDGGDGLWTEREPPRIGFRPEVAVDGAWALRPAAHILAGRLWLSERVSSTLYAVRTAYETDPRTNGSLSRPRRLAVPGEASIPPLREIYSLESFVALRNPELESITIDLPPALDWRPTSPVCARRIAPPTPQTPSD
jgi:hypothetical protein